MSERGAIHSRPFTPTFTLTWTLTQHLPTRCLRCSPPDRLMLPQPSMRPATLLTTPYYRTTVGADQGAGEGSYLSRGGLRRPRSLNKATLERASNMRV